MLRKSIQMLGLSACALAVGCGVSASGMGLSADFTAAARDAHRYMESHVIPEIRNARFPQVIAESRAKVKSLQTKATNDAERGVWLLLTMVNVKSNESRGVHELSGRGGAYANGTQAAWLEVTAERTQCMKELDGWLSGTASKLETLKASPCLVTAKQAASMLGR